MNISDISRSSSSRFEPESTVNNIAENSESYLDKGKSSILPFSPRSMRESPDISIKFDGSIDEGKRKVQRSLSLMVGVSNFIGKYKPTGLFAGKNILGCFTPTSQTGAFVIALKMLGANQIRWCSDNRHHSDKDVVAYLKSEGINIFAQPDMTENQFTWCFDQAMKFPESKKLEGILIIDDGADITQYIAKKEPLFFNNVNVIFENTTCGINFLKGLDFNDYNIPPVVDINSSFTKSYFDNFYGVSSSFVDSFKKITGQGFSGKNVAVFGYGPVGTGTARLLKEQDANVFVVESNILRLMQSAYDGHTPASKEEALANSDILVTSTGCCDVISSDDIDMLKDSVYLCNIGQNNNEFCFDHLNDNYPKSKLSKDLDCFTMRDGRKVFSLCQGTLANFLDGKGNSENVMSLTFGMHLVSMKSFYRGELAPKNIGLNPARYEDDCENAELNFPSFKDKVTMLNDGQKAYMGIEIHDVKK